jgi:PAS domain S-box-containing protein
MGYRTRVAKVNETSRSCEPLGDPLEFEALITELSSRFINLPPDEVDGAIEDALRQVCEFLAIDSAVLWQWSAADPAAIVPTHFYPARHGPLPGEPYRQEQYPWTVELLRAGRTVVVPQLEETPAEAAVDRETARSHGIKSNLSIPLAVGGAPPVGALAFNTTRAERDWPEALIKRLQMVAQVFANALARRRKDEALQESEERLHLAADSAEAGLWVLDYATGVFWLTERARALYGFAADEIVTVERFQAAVHPHDWDLVRKVIQRPAPAAEAPLSVEYRITRPGEGRVCWISSRGRAEYASTGEPMRLMGVSLDISERRHTRDALLASEARLEAAAELAGLARYEFDFSAGTAYFDDQYRDVCGIPPERDQELQVQEFWREHVHPDDRPHVMELGERLHDGRLESLSIEYRYLHPDHGERWLQHLARVAARDAEGRIVKSYGVLRDISERKRREAELQDLSRRLISAHEEERALLARDLHDDVSQRLAVLAITVGRSELATPDAKQAEAMRGIREELVRLSEDIHSLAYQLHPSVLEELGLGDALRAECERRARQGQLDISIDLGPLPALIAKDAALCLFRVAQEALTNAARHAQATTAAVKLRETDGGLLLAVSDDGVGFDPEHPAEGRRLGLASMHERVGLVQGTLAIQSAPGRGTTITAWVPAAEES